MLGNFSVGDYFKARRDSLGLGVRHTVSSACRRTGSGTPSTDDDRGLRSLGGQGQQPERIYRYGEREGNFWAAGDIGPCGPCSEIFYDCGEEFGCGPDCEPAHDCGRFLEIWNLVFMAVLPGTTHGNDRTPLPKTNIDTGAGLERISRVLQKRHRTYETDLFCPDQAAIERSRRDYGQRRGHDTHAAHHRRSRPRDHLPDRRWRAALQRGPRLRGAAPDPPQRVLRPRCSAKRGRSWSRSPRR